MSNKDILGVEINRLLKNADVGPRLTGVRWNLGQDTSRGLEMLGVDVQQESMFIERLPEQRFPKNRPLRPMKKMLDAELPAVPVRLEP